jgi:hypothetical protein
VLSEGIYCAVENPQASETWVVVGGGGHNEHRKQITCHFPSKFQTSNKLLSADNRAVFACGSWTFPVITPPQFRLGYIILGVIITETYFLIFTSTILCSPDKSGAVDTGKVPPHA